MKAASSDSVSGPGFFGLKASPSRRPYGAAIVAAPGKFSRDVIAASALAELYDEELGFEPYRKGIGTETLPAAKMPARLEGLIAGGVFACLIGYPSFPAALSAGGGYRHILFSPDFQDEGAVGKGKAGEELIVGARRGLPKGRGDGGSRSLTARAISTGAGTKRIRRLGKEPSLLTINPHVMDPALFPVRANLEPGGLQWYPLTGILRQLLQGGGVAALLMTPCRLPSVDGAPAFIIARLAAKILAYALSAP